jgi:ADP-heptose:LPS heptosyltransferase
MKPETGQASSSTRRVLIYRLGSLGDTVVALPSLHLIARAFPNAERRMLTNFPVNVKAPPAASVLENTGLVHDYFRYAVGTRNILQFVRLWWNLFRWKPDVLVYLGSGRGVESARRDMRFFQLCGIRRMIGVPLTLDMQKHRFSEPAQEYEPEAARLSRNIAELGDARLDDPANWDLHLTQQESARAAAELAPLAGRSIITVCVGTKQQSKDWGRDNWKALLERIARLSPRFALALCGSAEERELSDVVAEGWKSTGNDAVVNLCGLLTPRETAAVCQSSILFIGHDSGPMHLAAAVQTPCVAVFSARNRPRVWFPYGPGHRVIYHRVDCWGCNLVTCVVEKKKCIYSITVDEVLTEVRALLHNSGPLAEGKQ